jgi:hypothetical protein
MNRLLFQIQVLHSYFSNGVFQSCKVMADRASNNVLHRYGFQTQFTDGMFGCYIAAPDEVSNLVRYINEQQSGRPLRFFLVADEKQFAFITDLPTDWVGLVEMDSRSGAVRRSADGVTVELIPHLNDMAVKQHGVIGAVSVYLDDLLAMNSESTRYVANFHARSLPWHYYLVNRSQTKLYAPLIRDKHQVCLDGPKPMVLPNGERGLFFSSGRLAFPLQQVPKHVFDLIDRLPSSMDSAEQSIEHCLIHGLPTPDEDDLKKESNSKDVFGAMYVYL